MFRLCKGDKVGIISPSSCIENNDITAGLDYLRAQNLQPVLGRHVKAQYRYMGGTDSERAADIMDFFADSSVKALFCTRGGAGSLRILPHLDYDIIRRNPKPIFGFSDSTALQNGIYTQTANISYSGLLLLYDFRNGSLNPVQKTDLNNIFSGRKSVIRSGTTVSSGIAGGTLVGGNLACFISLCGTPYFPDLNGKILLLEDVGIKSYQLDIMLHQLKMQSGFAGLRGLIFGQYTNIRIVDECDENIDNNISAFCSEINIPAIKDFAYGHVPARHILPIGGTVSLDAGQCILSF